MDSWLAVVTDRTRMGTRVDLLFRANFVELGVSENGKISDVLCKRSLEELSVKCPKTLKNMLLRLARRAPVAASKHLSDLAAGLFINLLTMDCPRGYVCRVSRLPDWLQYPVSEVEFVKFIIPIIQLIWYAKKCMEAVLDIITTDDSIQVLSFIPQPKNISIPPRFSASPCNKKQKVDTSNPADNNMHASS